MTGDRKHLLLTGGALALAVLVGWTLLSGGAVKVSAGLDSATDAAGMQPMSYGGDHNHLAQPWQFHDVGRRLPSKHRLFSRPAQLGGDRALVSQTGWMWFCDPPSEAVL